MCSFENRDEPLCSWSHDEDADFKWRRLRGDEVSNFNWNDDFGQMAGPDHDHTLGRT